ncbi:F-box domain-containing protein [Blastomyces dermatitidis ATCC 18188]|uniref:F-box domain-containing protein n=1 Tax=Ajellomyces dermatitidis (strain ATCC 18188 / CBS 674.68) TaxID=653446 RepID=F2TGL6_AJEDA|nr:F-box domain-containing protein [Blastomyces dermatitidis ATCC 18188]
MTSSNTSTAQKGTSPLVLMPPEILYMILSFLPPPSLAALSSTCRPLSKHTQNDLLWKNLVNSNLPNTLSEPAPFNTWRELYISQFPLWFVARNKIWFSDVIDTGKLIVTRYNSRKGMIEGYRVVAKHTFRQFQTWTYDTEVLIHSFKPQVSLWTDDPVVQLVNYLPTPSSPSMNWRFGELRMPMAVEAQRVFNNFILCAKMPREDEDDPEKIVWPPRLIPSDERVDLSEQQNLSFTPRGNVPERYENLCMSAFQVRRWAQLGNFGAVFDVSNTRHGVSTYATLQPELYTPTREKPYQGIWVGDYSGHGSEFLLVLQRDGPFAQCHDDEQPDTENDSASSTYSSSAGSSLPVPRGRLEAIKLTGDPNVPRGQISFLAEDIGPGGLIRIADENLFKGARVVRGQGHIASTNFRDDKFIPAQLFLISHDCMALFWEELKHVSYYRRVDIDGLVNQELE